MAAQAAEGATHELRALAANLPAAALAWRLGVMQDAVECVVYLWAFAEGAASVRWCLTSHAGWLTDSGSV